MHFHTYFNIAYNKIICMLLQITLYENIRGDDGTWVPRIGLSATASVCGSSGKVNLANYMHQKM